MIALAAAAALVFAKPAELRWGASPERVDQALAGRCTSKRIRPINPPFLGSVRKLQQQIDCEGFEFEGQGRHAEFVFRDGELVMAWIMTGKDEDPRLANRMAAAYGEGRPTGPRYIVYGRARAALRLDKHEVLFHGPMLDAEIAGWWSQEMARPE